MRHPDPHFGYPTVSWRGPQQRVLAATSASPSPRFLRQGALVLGTHVDALDIEAAAQRIFNWGGRQQSRVVALCDVEALVLAHHDPVLHQSLAQADLTLPADAGVAWAMRREGQRQQRALTAHQLVWRHLALAQQAGQAVHFHLASPEALETLLGQVRLAFPQLRASGTSGHLTCVQTITETGAPIVFVALPHAEQGRWMHEHRAQVRTVMVGLGPDFAPLAPNGARRSRWSATWHKAVVRTVFGAKALGTLLLGTPASPSEESRD